MHTDASAKKTPITQDQFEIVCDQLSDSTDSVDKICKSIGISNRSFYQYKKTIGEIAEKKYARAKATQAENLINKINDLHEKMHAAILTCEDPKRVNAMVQAYKIEIDDYKWLASKLLPKMYGDKIDITSDGEKIINKIEVEFIQPSTKTNDNKNTQ
jgi:ACT domain-containing protein